MCDIAREREEPADNENSRGDKEGDWSKRRYDRGGEGGQHDQVGRPVREGYEAREREIEEETLMSRWIYRRENTTCFRQSSTRYVGPRSDVRRWSNPVGYVHGPISPYIAGATERKRRRRTTLIHVTR
nr:PREDICTED: uncharacterized protein LOC105662993 isoform X1 [Megachile rotundata]